MGAPNPDLRAVCARFAPDGEFRHAGPLGAGHIHDTFLVALRDGAALRRVVLQRLNERVFPDVDGLMENVARVTRHLQSRLAAADAPDADRRALALVATRDGATWLRDDDGTAWRAFSFIEGAASRPGVSTAAEARAVARAFGGFQRALSGLPAPPLREHLPGFHDGRARWAALEAALDADPLNRAAGAGPEIACAAAFAPLAGYLAGLAGRGVAPRPVHNDTKPDNLLRDAATGEPLCVIDLDTVMPGQGLADFGDLARAACCRAAEDEPDPARAVADPALFAALAAGFVEGAGDLLAPAEREGLVEATMALAWEQGVRFLADWLSGDRYYPARWPGHNLARCRVQFALLRSLVAREDALRRRVERVATGEEAG